MALTPQEALIYIMVVSAAADRTLSDGEIERIDGAGCPAAGLCRF